MGELSIKRLNLERHTHVDMWLYVNVMMVYVSVEEWNDGYKVW